MLNGRRGRAEGCGLLKIMQMIEQIMSERHLYWAHIHTYIYTVYRYSPLTLDLSSLLPLGSKCRQLKSW